MCFYLKKIYIYLETSLTLSLSKNDKYHNISTLKSDSFCLNNVSKKCHVSEIKICNAIF